MRKLPYSLLGLLVLATLLACQQTGLVLVASHDQGRLYECGRQKVLLLRGRPKEMGLQHGKLLAGAVRQVIRETLIWTEGRGLSRSQLEKICESLTPHLPERYAQEMAGLAEGSGAPLRDIQLVHAMPSRFHCSGAVVAGSATVDGRLYHSRSLDYALDLGVEGRLQNHALLIVRQPTDGHASAVPSWAGFLGAVTGMNMEGITLGEMGSSSQDESYDGMPMVFMLREVLLRAGTLEQALAIFEKGPRTCGYNFLVGSGDERKAVALEVTRSLFVVSGMNDAAENQPPHKALVDAVRRSNHFVCPETARTQRRVYDPRQSDPSSFELYDTNSRYLREQHGKLDARAMVALLREYSPTAPCLHQAVMAGTERKIYVSQAADDRKLPFPGAQNQDFYGYDLKAILAGKTNQPVVVLRPEGQGQAAGARVVEIEVEQHGSPILYRGRVKQSTRAGRVWSWTPEARAAPSLEVHEPRDLDENSPSLLIFSAGNQRLLTARSLAQALGKLGVCSALVQVLDPENEHGAARALKATVIAPHVLPGGGGSKGRIAWLGLGLGGPVAMAAKMGAPGQNPLILALTGHRLDEVWQQDKRHHRQIAQLLGVGAEVVESLAPMVKTAEDSPKASPGEKPDYGGFPVLLLGLRGEKLLPEGPQEKLLEFFPQAESQFYQMRLRHLGVLLPELSRRIVDFLHKSAKSH